MTKVELLEVIKDLPDGTEITMNDGMSTFEVYADVKYFYPANLWNKIPVIVFAMGQCVDLQFNLDHRESS